MQKWSDSLTFEPARAATGGSHPAGSDHGAHGSTGALPQGTAAARDLLDLILRSLDDDKAQDVVTIDLAGKTSVADAMVVASGRSHRHVSAIADHLVRRLKEAGHGRAQVEGLPHCDWVLIDVGDVVVHLFRPEVREFYNLEKMWSADMAEGAERGKGA
jgi:ribosome-associated protein